MKMRIIPRLLWLVGIRLDEPPEPIWLADDHMLPVKLTCTDELGNQMDPETIPMHMFSSDPEVADIKDGYLVPTGKKFGTVTILGVGPGLIAQDVTIVPSAAVSLKITTGEG